MVEPRLLGAVQTRLNCGRSTRTIVRQFSTIVSRNGCLRLCYQPRFSYNNLKASDFTLYTRKHKPCFALGKHHWVALIRSIHITSYPSPWYSNIDVLIPGKTHHIEKYLSGWGLSISHVDTIPVVRSSNIRSLQTTRKHLSMTVRLSQR